MGAALVEALLLLLSVVCFSRSSKRFEQWLYHTKLYQIYVADFRETGVIAYAQKKEFSFLFIF
ncbi:PF04304 domain protein [Streptococcus sp. AS20]|nr:PF04304 domain protein [Streptococcus sp. AS20]